MNRNFFQVLVKPSGADCNLRCQYCFYSEKADLYPNQQRRMTPQVLELLVKQVMDIDANAKSFCWQGGEPALMGLDFYRNAIQLQHRCKTGNQQVNNVLQTNGTLLDKDWADFLKANNVLVGISIDGPAKIHDEYRKRADGKGSHQQVIKGLKCLQRRKVECNALTLVNNVNCKQPEHIYDYIKGLGFKFHQYIECIEYEDDKITPKPFSLKPGQWGEFLCRIFDAWYPKDVTKVSIRLFDSIISRLATGSATFCPMQHNCQQYLVVEHNGDVYPCDFHVLPQYRLGNITETHLNDMLENPIYVDFGKKKSAVLADCALCRYEPLCQGDCPKHREFGPRPGRSLLCEDWKIFYNHTIERFDALATRFRELSRGSM